MKLSVRLTLRGNATGEQSVECVAEVEGRSEAHADANSNPDLSRSSAVDHDSASREADSIVEDTPFGKRIKPDRLNTLRVGDLKNQTSILHGSRWGQAGTIDQNGNSRYFEYDANGNAIELTLPRTGEDS